MMVFILRWKNTYASTFHKMWTEELWFSLASGKLLKEKFDCMPRAFSRLQVTKRSNQVCAQSETMKTHRILKISKESLFGLFVAL